MAVPVDDRSHAYQADLVRSRYRNPVAFRHNAAVSELPGISSRKADNSSPVASTVTRSCQQACPNQPSRPGHDGLLVPANVSRLTRAVPLSAIRYRSTCRPAACVSSRTAQDRECRSGSGETTGGRDGLSRDTLAGTRRPS